MARSLNAWINRTRVGTLEENNGMWAFAYSADWLQAADAYPLCPSLDLRAEPHVDGGTRRPVQWYFDNLLPEEGQRRLLAGSVRLDEADAFGLLAHFGAESAGSLTLLPPEQQPTAGGLLPLPETELSLRIQQMPQLPLAERSAKRMSLAGAQHKVALVFEQEALFEPVGITPSTHILKPDHPDPAWAHSVINEWFVMRLAGRVGLEVPAVHRRYVPQPVYLVERFDRRRGADDWQRLHCIDACQLLGLDRTYKYVEGSVERLAEIALACRPSAKVRLSLFRWLVFNVLVGNEDAHLKNLSCLVSPRGFTLAPFYDLICTAVYGTRTFEQERWPQQASLAWPILGVERLQQIDVGLLLAAGQTMGIKTATARDLIGKLVKAVREQSEILLAEVEEENRALSTARPELRATLAGEARLLRAVVNIVVSEMAGQLEGKGG